MDFPDFHSRATWLDFKMQSLNYNEKFNKLNDAGKEKLKSQIYDQYVVPIFQQAGQPIPDKELWMAKSMDKAIDPTFNMSGNKLGALQQTVQSTANSAFNMFNAGLMFTHREWMKQYTASWADADKIDSVLGGHYANAINNGVNKYINKAYEAVGRTLEDGINTSEFFLQTHPADSFLKEAGRGTGAFVAQLPFFETLGGGVSKLAGAAEALPFGVGKGVTTVSKALEATPEGRLTMASLHGATTGFLSAQIEGKDLPASLNQAAEWGVFGFAFGGLGEIGKEAGARFGSSKYSYKAGTAVVAGISKMKEYQAKVMAQVGKAGNFNILDVALGNSLDFNLGIQVKDAATTVETAKGYPGHPLGVPLAKEDLGYVLHGHPDAHVMGDIAVNPDFTSPNAGHLVHEGQVYPYANIEEMQKQMDFIIGNKSARMTELAKANEIKPVTEGEVQIGEPAKDLGKVSVFSPLAHMLGEIGVIPHADYPLTGHLVFDGQLYPYANAAQRQLQYSVLEHLAESRAMRNDPVKEGLSIATEKMLRDINQELHGTRNIKQTLESKDGAKKVAAVLSRATEIVHKAGDEIEIHNKDLVLKEEQARQEETIKAGTPAAKFMQILKEKHGIDTAKESADVRVDRAKQKAGIKDKTKTITRIDKGINRAAKGTPKDITASYNLEEALGKEEFAKLKSEGLNPLVRLQNMSQNTKAYFKNPNPGKLGSDALAKDGTRIGARNKDDWHTRLSKETTKEFVETLRHMDGDLIHFENPAHRILYHWGNRDTLPDNAESKAFKAKMQRELEKQFNTKKVQYKAKDFDNFSNELDYHLLMLAKTGQLVPKKINGKGAFVFRSTKLTGGRTEWQFQLYDDASQGELDMVNKLLDNHPEARDFVNNAFMFLQNKRASSYDVEEAKQYDTVINNLLTGQSIGEGKITGELKDFVKRYKAGERETDDSVYWDEHFEGEEDMYKDDYGHNEYHDY